MTVTVTHSESSSLVSYTGAVNPSTVRSVISFFGTDGGHVKDRSPDIVAQLRKLLRTKEQ